MDPKIPSYLLPLVTAALWPPCRALSASDWINVDHRKFLSTFGTHRPASFVAVGAMARNAREFNSGSLPGAPSVCAPVFACGPPKLSTVSSPDGKLRMFGLRLMPGLELMPRSGLETRPLEA